MYAIRSYYVDEEVPEPDRSWMAVAAYNLGLGHLRGARQIARSMKRDNSTWISMRGVLPLLSRPRITSYNVCYTKLLRR